MEAVLQWGLDFIRTIQGDRNPALVLFMRAVSTAGSAGAYMLLIALVYWCIDEKKGLRLGITLLVSAWINLALKFILDQPRPFFPGFAPDIALVPETLGGLPSGHAQNSLVICFILASWGKKAWHFAAAAAFCLLMAFSRIYLGVHFPTDILGGWLVGGIVLCAYFFAGRHIEAHLTVGAPRAGLLSVAALSFAMILYRPLPEMLLPAGMILGMGIGFYLCARHVGLSPVLLSAKPGFSQCLILLARFASGAATTAVIFILCEKLTNALQYLHNTDLFAFLRFAVIAVWITAGAPYVFRLLRLLPGKENRNTETTEQP